MSPGPVDTPVCLRPSPTARPCPRMCIPLRQVTLEPESPYLLVPSLAAAGLEAPFELRLMSSAPLELVPLPEAQVGGCRDEMYTRHTNARANTHTHTQLLAHIPPPL